MRPPNRNEGIQIKASQIVEGVLIWMLWGFADFLAGHNHPVLSDVSFFLFFVALMWVLASLIRPFWPRPRLITVLFLTLCCFWGLLVFTNVGASMPALNSPAFRF